MFKIYLNALYLLGLKEGRLVENYYSDTNDDYKYINNEITFNNEIKRLEEIKNFIIKKLGRR